MKRFYDNADAKRSSDGWAIALDDRPVKTPGRKPLAVPARKLADAIAAEWAGQEDKVDPAAMPLTGFANAAIDRIAPHREAFAAELAQYGETDLLCYRADSPAELVANQCAAWDPLLDWASERFDIGFETTTGIVHRRQPENTVERLKAAIGTYDAFRLAGLSPIVRIGGSLVAALALAENAFDEDTVWAATRVDEDWQAGQWGEDEEAIAARDARRREFSAGMRFLRLLEG
ncbi:MAG: ATP12 family chaperone protein [Parasphingopyxis sp.]|uniref:ATP12 family chaperone protein n=1 Tax=Parasphingopyxis sp. TaxID=1920299 RepID=UPI003F9F40E2